jgi:DNA-binding XRE family transcriptional regulator
MTEKTESQADTLRFAIPPYIVGLRLPGDVVDVMYPGWLYKSLEEGFAPGAGEIRAVLIRLRQTLRWSRAGMAALLGVSQTVVKAWESGARQPSGAARRLIWLVDMMVREPGKRKTAFDLFFWGRGDECIEFSRQMNRTLTRR